MTHNVTIQDALQDLINQPGLGMFAWMCLVFFVTAFVFFLWALKSGQFTDLEDTKLEMFDDFQDQGVKISG